MSVIFAAEEISISFGSNKVLDSVNFELNEQEVLGVIGPNGAGKTVMLNIITGILNPGSGRLLFEGKDISKHSIVERAHMGFGRTFQIPRSFANMTAYENSLVGAVFGDGRPESEASERVCEILDIIGLQNRRLDFAGKLSLLDRKRLEIGIALASNPKVLLLDEVAGGLTESEVAQILGIVAQIKASGVSIIWIEHVLQTMLHGTDRVMLLAEGRNVICGPPQTVMFSREVAEVYLGVASQSPPKRRKREGYTDG